MFSRIRVGDTSFHFKSLEHFANSTDSGIITIKSSEKVFVKILASLLLFVVIKFLYLTNEVSRSKMVSFCWQNDALRIDLFESAKYLKDVVVLSPSNSDTLVIVSYVTSSLSIFMEN